MDARVLADVEQREVKAEHLDLADDVAQCVLGDEPGVLLPQRELGDAQVGEQLRGALVAIVPALARGAQPRGEQLEQLPVRLLGIALGDGGGEVGEQVPEPIE